MVDFSLCDAGQLLLDIKVHCCAASERANFRSSMF